MVLYSPIAKLSTALFKISASQIEDSTVLDHIALSVSDYEKAKVFYLQALAPIGYQLVMEFNNNVAGIGIGKKPYFIIHGGGKQTPRCHVAFRTDNRAMVDAFYTAAIQAGGTDNGAPGIRERYHPNYYGAFVIDPDGHNIEVVCHEPE